jgi:hypothetical protein
LPTDLWQPLQLQCVAIRTPGDTISAPNAVTSVVDASGNFSRSMKDLPSGLALIRPDRYVAAYLQVENIEAGIREVDDVIASTWK